MANSVGSQRACGFDGLGGLRELKESSLRPESDSETGLHRVQEETSREEIRLIARRPTWSRSLAGKRETEKAVVSKGWGGWRVLTGLCNCSGRGKGSEHSQDFGTV